MKKLVLVLAIALIAVPAFAAVTLTESGKTGTTVTVGYDATGAVLPRAFGLTLVATGGTITSVTATKVGESTSGAPGYGIFPGTIDINEVTGVVASYGSPVEPNGLPGGGELGTYRVIVALGSLYAGGNDSNKPGVTGNLFTVVCSSGTTSLTVSEEDTYRGGVVDVNAVAMTVAPKVITFAAPDPYANTCWDVTKCPRQTFGDATCDGAVNIADLVALKAAWLAAGPPWVGSKCCSDFTRDHAANIADLVRLKANWLSTGTGTLTLTCPTVP